MNYQPLLMNFEEAAELAQELGKDTLLGNALARDITQTDAYMADVGIEVLGTVKAVVTSITVISKTIFTWI